MIRKFVGTALLLSVFSLMACSGSGSGTKSDECVEDPMSPICSHDDRGGDDMVEDGENDF